MLNETHQFAQWDPIEVLAMLQLVQQGLDVHCPGTSSEICYILPPITIRTEIYYHLPFDNEVGNVGGDLCASECPCVHI